MYAEIKEPVLVCFHCGNDCEDEIIFSEEKSFCCTGCKSVYDILDENGLCGYYSLNKNPGVSQKENSSSAFTWLDEKEFSDKFTLFESENRQQVKFIIPAIHCSSCIWLIEQLPKLNKNILSARVKFREQEVYLLFNPGGIRLSEVVSLLQKTGYTPDLHRDVRSEKGKKPVYFSKKYLMKLGVAFFCFGNIMLLSFPEYLGIETSEDDLFRHYFSYLGFILILPVMFFSASEFFVSAWNGIKNKKINMDFPIALGILVMFFQSTYLIFSSQGAGYMDTLASLVFLMLIGRTLQNMTWSRISFERDHRSWFPVAVTVLENGKEKNVAVNEIVPSQVICMRNNEIIPADGIMKDEKGFFDYSFVTGESKPVRKMKGEKVFAGGKLVSGSARIEVTQKAEQSYLNALWDNDMIREKEKNIFLDTLSNKISLWFTLAILTIAVAGAVYWFFVDSSLSVFVFTAVLIITCPCALALSTPFTMGNAMVVLGRNRFYLKSTQVLEQISRADTVLFDKTGTLTSTGKNEVRWNGSVLTSHELLLISSLVKNSSHPLSKSVYRYIGEKAVFPAESYTEKPGKGISAFFGKDFVKAGSARFLHLAVTGNGFSSSGVHVSVNNIYKGYFSVSSSYRPGTKPLAVELKKRYSLHLLSGDSEAEKDNLEQLLGQDVPMQFNMSPDEKLEYVKKLQEKGKKVIMIGDGLNDVGALRQANAGISVSEDANNFSPACDVILSASHFSQLSRFFRFSRAAVNVVKASFIISFIYNVVGIYFAVTGTLSPLVAAVLMPASSVSIILFTTLSVYFLSKSILKNKN